MGKMVVVIETQSDTLSLDLRLLSGAASFRVEAWRVRRTELPSLTAWYASSSPSSSAASSSSSESASDAAGLGAGRLLVPLRPRPAASLPKRLSRPCNQELRLANRASDDTALAPLGNSSKKLCSTMPQLGCQRPLFVSLWCTCMPTIMVNLV